MPEEPDEPEQVELGFEAAQEEAAEAQREALFEDEARRLECMLDQTVMSEERRLRSMLVSPLSGISLEGRTFLLFFIISPAVFFASLVSVRWPSVVLTAQFLSLMTVAGRGNA